jgi:Protein of unknown function
MRDMDEIPPGEIPTVSSTLRWQDVTLPNSVSEANLDAIIFSILTQRLQKTAMVVGNAVTHCREHGLPIGAEMIGARVRALADAGGIESAGDISYWRHSEVRLKD